jgi:hypothetical protein
MDGRTDEFNASGWSKYINEHINTRTIKQTKKKIVQKHNNKDIKKKKKKAMKKSHWQYSHIALFRF